MNAKDFIDVWGLDKAKRILNNKIYDAEFYSDRTGSYYSENKNESVNLRELSKAIAGFEKLKKLEAELNLAKKQWWS